MAFNRGIRASLGLACLIGAYIAMRHRLDAVPESTPEMLATSFLRKEMESEWKKGSLLAQKTMEAVTNYKPFTLKLGKDKLLDIAQQAGLGGLNELLRLMVTPFLPGRAGKPVKQGAIPWIVDDGTDDGVMWLAVPVGLPLPAMPEVKAKRGLDMGEEGAGGEQTIAAAESKMEHKNSFGPIWELQEPDKATPELRNKLLDRTRKMRRIVRKKRAGRNDKKSAPELEAARGVTQEKIMMHAFRMQKHISGLANLKMNFLLYQI